MTDLMRAKELLGSDPSLTCVFVRGDEIVTSTQRGIRPLVERVAGGKSLKGFSAADRIVGRAAAFLYVCLQAEEVYAAVLGEGAAAVLETHGIGFLCGIQTAQIVNRAGNGPCPMEAAVEGVSDPAAAVEILRKKVGI